MCKKRSINLKKTLKNVKKRNENKTKTFVNVEQKCYLSTMFNSMPYTKELELEVLNGILELSSVISGLAVAGRYTSDCCYALSCSSTCVRHKNKNKIKNTLAK